MSKTQELRKEIKDYIRERTAMKAERDSLRKEINDTMSRIGPLLDKVKTKKK